jgi:CRP/FNR family cyclic AMP-dependent transcriptional regulator
MYIVLSGAAQIFLPPREPNGERVVLKDVRTGEYFGELALFDDKPRSASVDATVDTTLLELTRDEFAEHLSRSKTAALAILSEMAERLRETNSMLEPARRDERGQGDRGEPHVGAAPRRQGRRAQRELGVHPVPARLSTVAWAIVNIPPHRRSRRARGPRETTARCRGSTRIPFILYNLVLAILVALQGPLIVMSQNRQSLKDRAQAETDFRVNLKNEVGIETLVRELGAFRVETTKRLDGLERAARAERVRARGAGEEAGRADS